MVLALEVSERERGGVSVDLTNRFLFWLLRDSTDHLKPHSNPRWRIDSQVSQGSDFDVHELRRTTKTRQFLFTVTGHWPFFQSLPRRQHEDSPPNRWKNPVNNFPSHSPLPYKRPISRKPQPVEVFRDFQEVAPKIEIRPHEQNLKLLKTLIRLNQSKGGL